MATKAEAQGDKINEVIKLITDLDKSIVAEFKATNTRLSALESKISMIEGKVSMLPTIWQTVGVFGAMLGLAGALVGLITYASNTIHQPPPQKSEKSAGTVATPSGISISPVSPPKSAAPPTTINGDTNISAAPDTTQSISIGAPNEIRNSINSIHESSFPAKKP